MINFNEEQILSLKFDSQAFVEGVDDAIDIIKSLNNTIKTFKDDSSTVGSRLSSVFGSITSVLTVFSKHSEGILSDIFKGFSSFSENINSEANEVDFTKINNSLEYTGHKFSVFEELVRGIFIRLGSQITDFAENKIKLLTIDQALSGWGKYQTLVKKTQTMMATGANEEEVTVALRQLAWYADETSYSLEDMVSNLSKFVSYGISVGDAATEIMGIDNAVAKAGSSIQQATSAQEAFARAFSMGYMSLSVWRHQLTTSGLITEDFKNKCIEAGLQVGTLYKDVNGVVRSVNKDMAVTATGMENTLTEAAWMTKDVMETMLKGYAASAKEIEYVYQNTDLTTSEIMEAGKEFFDQYSLEAFQMGQEALTLEQSIESLWDAMSTQWANVFTNIFGTYKDAKVLWTDLANWLNEIFVTPFYNLVDFTAGFTTTLEEDGGYLVKYRKLVEEECGLISNVFTETSGTIQEALREGFLNILRAISSYVDAFKLAWGSVFNSATIKQVGNLVGSFTNFTEKLILSDDQVVKLATHLSNLFRILKIIKDVIIAIYNTIRDFLEPIIRKLFEYINPALDKIADSLSNALTKVQSFLKTTFGIDFKNTNILKEFQKLNDSSSNLLDNIETIKKKLKEYREANPAVTSVTENLTGLESKIKDINALTSAASVSNLTDFDVGKLQSLTDSLADTAGYLDKGAFLLKKYTDALDEMKKQGNATYEDIEKLNSIIKELNGELNKNYIFEDLNNINWSNLTDADIKNLKAYNEELKNSSVYISEAGELGEKYKQKLESMGKAGKVTASDLKELNDILDQLSDTKKTRTELSETNDEIIALQYAINKIKNKDKIEDKDIAILEELYKRLEKAEKESNNSSKALDEFSDIVKEIGKNSELTASDIDKISGAIDKLKGKLEEENKKETELEKKRRLRDERMQHYNEALAASQNLTDQEKIIFWGQYYQEESRNRRKEAEELRKQNKIKKETNELTKESLAALKNTADYSSKAFKNINKISNVSSNISKTVGNVNNDVSNLNENSQEATKNIDSNTKSVNDLTDSEKKLDSSINEASNSAKDSAVPEKIDETKESSKDAETWASKLANSLKSIFTSNEFEESKDEISNNISEIGDKLAEASKNAEKVDSASKNKSLSKYINDWLGKLDISKGNIVKVLLGVTVFTIAVKKIYDNLGTIASERPEIFSQASKNIMAMGFALIEASAAISLIMASEYLFGNSEKAINTVTNIFKLMRNTLFIEFAALGIFKKKFIKETAIAFTAMGFALLEAAAAIAIINRILNKSKNGDAAIKAVMDLLKEFRKLIIQVSILSKESSASTILASAFLVTAFTIFIGGLGLALYLIGKVSNNFTGAYTVLLGIVDIIKKLAICINALSILVKAGTERELISCAFVLFGFSTVILSIGAALGIVSYVQNKYGSISSDNFYAIAEIIRKIKNSLTELTFLALFAKDDKIFFKVEKVIFAFAACILAIGVAVGVMAWIDSKNKGNSLKHATKSIRSIIEQLKDCIRSIIIFSSLYKHEDLENVNKVFYSFAAVVFAIGAAVSAIVYFDGLNGKRDIKKATKSIRSIIEQLKDCIRSIIIFSSLFKSNYDTLESASDVFYSLSACIMAMGLSVSLMTYVSSKYGGDVKKSSKVIISCIDEIKYLADSLIVFSSIFNKGNEYSADKLEAVAKNILALSAPILAIGITISLISYFDSKYGNTEPAMENLILMMKEIVKIGRIIAFMSSIFSGIDLPFGNMGKSSWLYQLGLALIEISWAVEIVAKTYKKYGKDATEDAFDALKTMVWSLGGVGAVLIAAGGLAGKFGGKAGAKSKSIRYAAKTLLAIGLAILEVSIALAIVAGIRKLVGDPDEFKESTDFIEGAIWDLGIVAGILILVAGKFDTRESQITRASALMISIGTALLEVSVALGLVAYAYHSYGGDAISEALYDIGVMLFAMGTTVAALMYLADYFSKNNVAGKVGLLSLGFAAVGFALMESATAISAVAYVSSITDGATTKAMYNLAELMFAMTIVIVALAKVADTFKKSTGKVVIFSLVMNILGIAMNVFAAALDTVAMIYNKYKWWTAAAATTLVVMIGALGLIVDGLAALGAKAEIKISLMLASAAAVVILSIALKPIANALDIIGNIRKKYGNEKTIWELVGVALAAIGGLAAILFGLSALTMLVSGGENGVGAGFGAIIELASSGAILLISIGLEHLAKALKQMQGIQWETLGKAASILGGLFIAISGLMALAQTLPIGAGIIYGGLVVIAIALYIVAAAFERFAKSWAIFKAADSVNGTVTIIQNTEDEYRVGGDSIYSAAKEAGLKGPAGLVDGIKENASLAINSASDLISSIIAKVKEKLGMSDSKGKDLPKENWVFYKNGRYIVQGLIDGIKSLNPETITTVQDFAKLVVDTFNTEMGIESPSKEMESSGKNTVEGFNKGVIDNQSTTETTMSTFAKDKVVKPVVDTIGEETKEGGAVYGAGGSVANAVVDGMNAESEKPSFFKSIGNFFGNLFGSFTGSMINASGIMDDIDISGMIDTSSIQTQIDESMKNLELDFNSEEISKQITDQIGTLDLEGININTDDIQSQITDAMSNLNINTDDIQSSITATGDGLDLSSILANKDVIASDSSEVANLLAQSYSDALSSTKIQNGVSSSASSISDATVNGMKKTSNGRNLFDAVVDIASLLCSTYISTLEISTPLIRDAFSNLISNVFNMGTYLRKIKDLGSNIISGLIGGMHDKFEKVKGAAINICSGIKNAFLSFFNIHSPSRVMKDIGENVINGLINGVSGEEDKAVDAALSFANAFNNEIMNSLGVIMDYINSDFEYSPMITPVVNLDNIANAKHYIDNEFTSGMSSRTNSSFSRMRSDKIAASMSQNANPNSNNAPIYNYTQNNYSPKALSEIEIYRRTNNQLNFRKFVGG